MNFVHQGFESYRLKDGQTDTTEIIYHAVSRVIRNVNKVCLTAPTNINYCFVSVIQRRNNSTDSKVLD